MQAPNQPGYPIIVGAPAIPTWHNCAMDSFALGGDEPAFDRDLVRARMKELKVTQTMMAGWLGIPQSAVSNMLKGDRQVKVHEASLVYKRLGLNRPPDVQNVPIIGLTNAGNWREAIQSSDGKVPMPSGLGGARSFAVQVRGDSLDLVPVVEGEYVVCDPDQTQLYTDKVYLIENDEHETQIKVYRSNPARFEPKSTNETHQTLYMGQDKIRVIGRIVWRGGAM